MPELVYPLEPAPVYPRPTVDAPGLPAVSSEEMLPLVEPSGLVYGQATRAWCHSGAKALHPVVHLHLVDRLGRIYLQKRSLEKDLLPGYWDTAVGGHVTYGELAQEALYREAAEELGLTAFNPVFLETNVWETERDREFVFVFACVGHPDLHPDNDEVTAVVKLDAETVQTLDSVVLGYEYRLNISGTKLNQLANGAHTITITAQDSYENTSTKTVTFNKTAASVAISGTDGTIGNWWTLPHYEYTVSDTEGKQITVTESVDGETTNTVENAGQKGTISFKMNEIFETLDNENTHTLTIKAVNADGAEAYRNITFTKLAENLCFETKPIETDAAAEKIIVNIDYDKQGSPELKVEVTNCAYNGAVVWEDATEEVVARKAYNFKNTTFDSERFGVAVRVTITKNINTERVYCNSLGFCFD